MKYFLLIWNNCEQFKIITEVSLMMLRYIRADGRFGFLISSHHPVSEQLGKINNMLIIQINLATILKWNVWLHVLSVYPPPSSHFKWVREQCTRTVSAVYASTIHIVIVTYNITDNVLTHPLPSCNWEKCNSNRHSPETCFSSPLGYSIVVLGLTRDPTRSVEHGQVSRWRQLFMKISWLCGV